MDEIHAWMDGQDRIGEERRVEERWIAGIDSMHRQMDDDGWMDGWIDEKRDR